jgi:hypothetical protein
MQYSYMHKQKGICHEIARVVHVRYRCACEDWIRHGPSRCSIIPDICLHRRGGKKTRVGEPHTLIHISFFTFLIC